MIVRMKKITMAVLNKNRQDFLLRLRKEGVVHIKHLARPAGQDIVSVEEKESQIKKAIAILEGESRLAAASFIQLQDETQLLNKVNEIVSLHEEIEELEKKKEDAKNTVLCYKPWGAFNPEELLSLKDRGIYVKLYVLNKSELNKIKGQDNIYIAGREGNYFYIAGLFYEQDKGLPFTEVKLPLENISKLQTQLVGYNKRIEEIKEFLKKQAVFKQVFGNFLQKLEKGHRFLEVFYGMKHEDGFSLLQGFCPKSSIPNVIKLAEENNIGYLIENPDNPEETPTLIENPWWLRITDPIFKFINTIPGYNEFDISPVFLIFFSLFFAIIVGDAGYGLLFCISTYFIRRKAKNLPPEPFRLLYVLSFSTVIWGAVTGTWFGFEKIARLPVLNNLIIGRINSFGEGNQNLMIYICFIIGVIHLSIAHIMKFIRTINSIQSIAQIGWIFVLWGLFFLAGTLVVNRQFPFFAKYFLMFGTGIILLFSNFQKNILVGMLITLKDLPLGIAGSFGDIVSYLRLFAVGSASVAVASSFNSMALDIGFGNILSGFFAALILFAAHALNITLSFLAVIVHGVRLNMLEFSGHLGMEWSGNKYVPFSE